MNAPAASAHGRQTRREAEGLALVAGNHSENPRCVQLPVEMRNRIFHKETTRASTRELIESPPFMTPTLGVVHTSPFFSRDTVAYLKSR